MATRLYLPLDTAAPVNPGFGVWNYTSEAVRRLLARTKGSSAITIGTRVGPWTATAGQKALDRQYVSDPLSAQTISGTVAMQLMVREYATADNVNQLILLIKVVSKDGGTLRGTLLALGNYGPTLEFISNATHRNKTGADGDTLTPVDAQEGDRIVVEIGYCNSVAGTTPEASAKFGENATDLPVNETQTTNGAGWIEFSANIGWMEYLSGVSAGGASASGSLSRMRGMSGVSAGIGSAIGVLSRQRPLTGASAGAGSAAGILSRKRPLYGSSTGGASVAGALSRVRSLLGNSAGGSSAWGNLRVESGGDGDEHCSQLGSLKAG